MSDRLEIKGVVEAGDRCLFRGNVVLRTHFSGRILLADDVELGDYAMISANEYVEIGQGSYIGPYCVLRDNNHLFQGTDAHWRITPLIIQPIKVGRNCYLGAGTYIMPGVTIGDGAVVAPRSIVTKDIGSLEVWAGAPALRVSHRTDPLLRSSLKRHQELAALFEAPAARPAQGVQTG
ncbi:MAG: acyltransferase [Candidatus Hydrogenedentes bacterium]|nr:acyltransferase [Candidatus Hydrogenedentota bacterium]